MYEEIEQIVILICLAIGLFAGSRFLKKYRSGKSKNQTFIENAEKNGHYTTAEVIDTEVFFGDRDSNIQSLRNKTKAVTYRYIVDGKEYTRGLLYQSPGVTTIRYPQTLQIYYDPRNPQEAHFKNEESNEDRNQAGCLKAIAVTLGTMYGLFLLFRLVASLLLGSSA